MSGVVAVLIVGGASAWFVTRSNAPPTHSPATPTSARTTGSSGESSTPALGQSSTVAVDGTTLSMTITKTLRPAPLGVSQRVETKGRVGIAAYVTVTNSGRRSYSLTKLVFGLTVGALSVGGVGYDTTAGSALPRTGHLAPGATAAGWVTQLGPASGRIRSVSCAFDVHSGTSAWKTVFRIWTVK
jgi:hypothetical protein